MTALKKRVALAALKHARSELGTTEDPPGSNRNEFWLETKPEWNGSYWCAAFCTAMYLRAGFDLREIFSNPYYCPTIEVEAGRLGAWTEWGPKQGDLVLYGNPGQASPHIGIHEKTEGSDFIAIEGNTSAEWDKIGSQNNGGGVYRRRRPRSWIHGWVDMRKLIADHHNDVDQSKLEKPKLPDRNQDGASRDQERAHLLTIDGQFGPNTCEALQRDLNSHGWHLTVDGDPGPNTNKALQVFLNHHLSGRNLTVDGVGLDYNIDKRVPARGHRNTISHFQRYVGSVRDGVLDAGDSSAIRAYQEMHNRGDF